MEHFDAVMKELYRDHASFSHCPIEKKTFLYPMMFLMNLTFNTFRFSQQQFLNYESQTLFEPKISKFRHLVNVFALMWSK